MQPAFFHASDGHESSSNNNMKGKKYDDDDPFADLIFAAPQLTILDSVQVSLPSEPQQRSSDMNKSVHKFEESLNSSASD